MKQYITKKDLIYRDLKEGILNGKYEFGDKLVISRLAKEYSVSEIPVREALNLLNSDNLIEFKPHVGAIVSTISSEDIKDIFEMRIELEGLATRLATEHLDMSTLNVLENNITKSRLALQKKNYDLYEQLNMDFHLEIYKNCGNKLLYSTIVNLWNNTKRYPSLFNNNATHITSSIDEHEHLLNALKNNDAIRAENWMVSHKSRAGEEILRVTQNKYYNEFRKRKNLE